MLYFAYGSNLSHQQMKGRCTESKYVQAHILKGYELIFSHHNPNNKYGHANIEKKVNFEVPGAIWKITKNVNSNKYSDEKILDSYEGFPIYYQKDYINWEGKKALVYIQNVFAKRKPSSDYLHIIIKGYKDCGLDLNYLKRRIYFYSIAYDIKW